MISASNNTSYKTFRESQTAGLAFIVDARTVVSGQREAEPKRRTVLKGVILQEEFFYSSCIVWILTDRK